MKRSDLSPKQRDVVNATEDTLLVVGGAGTGKTTVALWAARAELLRPRNRDKRVLFLTFSRTAVDQIISRSRSVVSSVGDRIEVSTFHAFAYRLIRRFGHLSGLSDRNPVVQSASRAKLLGKASDRLEYDDLAPLARQVMDDPRVAALLEKRWCMVICDEFQDTGDTQWAMLERLSEHARLMLLGDEHQLIYGFLAPAGVTPARMDHARSWVDRTIELELASHRDPSGAIPALATAIRQRRFKDPAVLDAIEAGRLLIRTGIDNSQVVSAIGEALDAAWSRGSRSFGVFAHSNQSVAELSVGLSAAGIGHYLVGLPDAEADALASMLALVQYAYGQVEWPSVRVALATYLTACSRGRPPAVARALAAGTALPSVLETRVSALQARMASASAESLLVVADAAATAWASVGITGTEAPWERSAPTFRAIARQSYRDSAGQIGQLARAVDQLRVGAMFESQRRRLPAVQVMNLHQTKGREADAVIILCADDDFHGYEKEPFVEGSRLLYVILTRARFEVTVLLGSDPHPLVAPIAALAPTG